MCSKIEGDKALVAQWIEQLPSKKKMEVRFLPRAPGARSSTVEQHPLKMTVVGSIPTEPTVNVSNVDVYLFSVVNRSTVRKSNKDDFEKSVALRKQGLSYGEILKIVPIAKSTLQNWLTLSGLTLTKEHLEIQLKKRVENKRMATESSKLTRDTRINKEVDSFISSCRNYVFDPLFIAGIIAYESEGAKSSCKFSNSDHRMIQLFINFVKKYVFPLQKTSFKYRIFIHENRLKDLDRIKDFWSKKLSITKDEIKLTLKRNIVKHRRYNDDYVGQMLVTVSSKLILKKLQRLSDIIIETYCGVV